MYTTLFDVFYHNSSITKELEFLETYSPISLTFNSQKYILNLQQNGKIQIFIEFTI